MENNSEAPIETNPFDHISIRVFNVSAGIPFDLK